MCISPSTVWVLRGPKWEQTPVPCKKCWRCKSNRVSDYVARAMCEAATSEISATVTLTYAPRDDLADKILTQKHFQLFMKLLRNAGHKVRYLVAGEYGDDKGRAHFHAILFFQYLAPLDDPETGASRGIVPRYADDYPPGFTADDAPFCRQIPHKRMVHIREWPHGHIKVDWSASEESIRYVCKYLLADDKNNAWFSLSKKPAIGSAWFAEKAAKSREAGLLPYSFEYLPPGGNRDRPYLMTGATRRDYLNAITIDPSRRDEMSDWTKTTFDKHDRDRIRRALEIINLLQGDDDISRFADVPDDDIEAAIVHDADWVRWWLHQEHPRPAFNYKYPSCDWSPSEKVLQRVREKYRGEVKNKKPSLWRIGGTAPCDGETFLDGEDE